MKEPAVCLAQFMGDEPPFNNLENICKYMASLGYKGIQIPTFDPRCVDLKKLAESKTYADEIKGIVHDAGEGAPFIASHIIRKSEKSFEDFAGGGSGSDEKLNRKILGLE